MAIQDDQTEKPQPPNNKKKNQKHEGLKLEVFTICISYYF